MFCLADFEEQARQSMQKSAFEFYSYGASRQQTLKDNGEAFSRYVCVCTATAHAQ